MVWLSIPPNKLPRKNSNVTPVKSLNMERSPKNSSNTNKENIASIPVKSPNMSRIPMKSPNSLFVKNQKKIVKPMMGIGSKIPLSNAKMAKKGWSDQNMPKQRHSSPVKLPVNGRLRSRISLKAPNFP